MADPVTKLELENASVDAGDLGDILNSDSSTTVTTRLGLPVKSVANAVAGISAYDDNGAWLTSTVYVIKDLVQESGITYICTVAHTSGTFATDKAAGKWGIFQTQLPEAQLTSYASLSAAIAAIGATKTTLLIDKDDALTGALTIPSTITLRKIAGYKIATSGNVLTCNAWIESSGQLFDISGGGSVAGTPGNKEVDVVWFGAGLGLGDDSLLISAAFDFAKRGTNIDTAEERANLVGYSKEYVLTTSLTLGETAAPTIAVIDLNGGFKTNPALTYAIKLRHFKQPSIKLGRIVPTSASVNTGVIVENCFEGQIVVNQIGAYDVPINLHGEGSYGFQGNAYFKLEVGAAGTAADTTNAIELTTANVGYVNSCFIQVTAAAGDVFSKHTKGAGQTDPYNNNEYIHCGLENIDVIGFDWAFTNYNHVHYPRLESTSINFSSGVIDESSDCLGNTFDLFVIVDTKIGTLYNESILNARILNASGTVIAKQASQTTSGRIYYSDRASASGAQNLTVFTEGNTAATSTGVPLSKYRGFYKDSAGVIHPYGLGTPFAVKRITSYTGPAVVTLDYETTVDLTVDSGALEIRSHADRQFEGFEIILNVTVAHTDLTFAHNDGTLPIAKTAFPTAGVYMLKRIDYRWRASRIGDAFAVS